MTIMPNSSHPSNFYGARLALTVGLILAAAAGAARASQVAVVNLATMTRQADRVFRGVCVSARSGLDARGLPVSEYLFRNFETLAGTAPTTVTVRQYGLLREDRTTLCPGYLPRIEGMPEYRVGSEYLLFLNPTSALGLTSPIGLEQGRFHVLRDRQGRMLAVNGAGNANLFVDDPQGPGRPAGLRALSPPGPVVSPIAYEDLARLTRDLRDGRSIDLPAEGRRLIREAQQAQGGGRP